MDRYRLIAAVVLLVFYLYTLYPLQTTIVAIAIAVAYIVLRNMPGRLGEVSGVNNGKEIRRRQALKDAKIYLSPYNDIWRNLSLSNKYCTLRLGSDGLTITARDKVNKGRTFRVIQSRVHENSDLWDMFCRCFEHNTTFDGLVQLCNTFHVELFVENGGNSTNQNIKVGAEPVNVKSKSKNIDKLDINNASEIEITALPGISIVMAKKIIKKREELNGFKTVDDVCLFLRLKPHIEIQIRELICVKTMRGTGKVKRYNERSIDL